MVAAYIRVSSRSQDYETQRLAIERACRARGDVVHRWYADVASGRSMDRRNLLQLREQIHAGNVARLWVWRLDRLTRSGILDTLAAVHDCRRHGCELVSVADGFALDGPAADVVLAVLAWAAQMEREKIRENQASARARMVAEGRSWGRPRLPAAKRDEIRALSAAGRSLQQIARASKVSKTTAWNVLRETDH